MYLSQFNNPGVKAELFSENKAAPVFLAGRRGLVGSALFKLLQARGHQNIFAPASSELDLTDSRVVNKFFAREQPAYVFLAAALVGGIAANSRRPAEFIHHNLLIQDNLIHAAYRYGVRKLLFTGSNCMYPRDCPQPVRAGSLLEGPPEVTCLPFATAKIAGVIQCAAYRSQYGLNAITAVPASIYGPGDNFDPDHSHVLAALMHRIHQAKITDRDQVLIWGDGSPTREFLFVDDAAAGIYHLMDHYDDMDPVNLGTGQETSVRDLAEMICQVVGYRGQLCFDTSKPNGAPRKVLDSSIIKGLGWQPLITLQAGLELTYRAFLAGAGRRADYE